jgi:hypothetical protein
VHVCAWLLITMTSAVYAARVHLIGEPTFEDLGTNIETCLTLAGLGNKDVTITVSVTGTASVTYINPGGNIPAGQNKFPISSVVMRTLPSKQIKNGTVSVCLTTPDIDVGDAPNPNWTVRLDDIEFKTCTITVVQNGKVVLTDEVEF